jgi:hypothetical protein
MYLWIDNLSAYVIPVRDLPPPMTVHEAVTRLRGFKSANVGAAAPVAAVEDATSSDAPADPASAVTAIKPTVWQELVALFRLETLRAPNPEHLFGRDATLILLGAALLALWIGLDRIDYGVGAEFMLFGLSAVGTATCALLLLAWLLSRFSLPRLPLRRTLLLALASCPFVVVGAWAGPHISRALLYLFAFILAGATALMVHAGLRAMTGRRQPRAIGAAGVACLLLIYGWAWLNPGGAGFWYMPDDEYDTSTESLAALEQVKFEQAPRIYTTVANMPAGDAAQAAMYFVGFAGFGEQRVFAEEIGTAASVVAEKYGTGDRELRLINDRRDEQTWPLASVSALRYGLVSLGERMNRENDVLFLSLSSHGGEDATLSVMNSSMDYWLDLDAPSLRAMLDESGIRWRVIVISACHAGSFIESLANEQTIVLTAAAKENTSFGCSDDRDLTYFGEAFYRDALPKAASLRDAFEQARVAIAEREKTEGVAVSDPQAHFGAALETKLAQMAAAKPPAPPQGR